MKYDPTKHHRRSIRLKGYDYTQPGAYFVTINTQDRACLFGDVVDGEMVRNVYGQVAYIMWERIPRHFPHVQLDAFVVMPDHLHGIVVIVDDTDGGGGEAFHHISFDTEDATRAQQFASTQGADGNAPSLQYRDGYPNGPPSGSLGAIVGNFKSVAARRINRVRKTTSAPVWQRNYHEHIIRNQRELDAIRRYIEHNPVRWEENRYGD